MGIDYGQIYAASRVEHICLWPHQAIKLFDGDTGTVIPQNTIFAGIFSVFRG